MEELLALCLAKGITIGSCESLTAGLFSASLAAIPNASKVLLGGIVSYQNSVKENVVGVDRDVIVQHGVVSEECAIQMARNTKKILACDLCVSFSGNAGPGTMEDKPAGLVYCAVAYQGIEYPFCFQLKGTRNEVREQVVKEMVRKIINIINDVKE